MPLPRPTPAELAGIAERLGYRSALDSIDEYTALVSAMLDAYDAVDAVGEQPVLASRGPVESRFPTAEEDPHHAWYVRTSIRGAAEGPLAGMKLAVKDSVMVAGVPMMNGADLLEGYTPDVDATVVTRVLEAGAEIVGKTACEYFCLSGGSHTNAHGPTHNPHRHGWSAGGSSSGSAVAVATGEADLALGADQAGSIRMPASFSGIVGLKPTYGLVPYTGIAPIEALIDHVGPMARTVEGNARLLQVIAGADGVDPRQRDVHVGNYTADLGAGVRGLRVGVLREGFGHPGGEPDVDIQVRQAATVLEKLGADVAEVSIPLHLLGPALWTPIAIEGLTETVLRNQGFAISRDDHYPVDMMEHLLRRRGDADRLPANVKLFTLLGSYVQDTLGRTYYGKAVNRVRTLRAAYDAALRDVDVLLMPTTPQKAQPLPDPADGVAEWCRRATEMFANTCPFDVTHHPALSLPCGVSDGLPVGLMLVGRHFDEATLYRVGQAYEHS
ncbi:amidase [Modestobacter lapidis]|nr:amidase [Modestobacter lapidis]